MDEIEWYGFLFYFIKIWNNTPKISMKRAGQGNQISDIIFSTFRKKSYF